MPNAEHASPEREGADDPALAVGFIGLGRMGTPMCRNLLRAGFALTVHTRTPARAEPVLALGAAYADSPGALAERCDVVLACLDTVAASEVVFLGDDGVVARARPGTVLIDHGTIGPDTARVIGAAAAARGVTFLDAPVSGGPEGAEQGTLAIMMGGDAAACARVLPVLRAYGRTVARMGGVGAGSLAKLVNQLLTFVHGAAAAEAIALAERVGLDLAVLGDVLGAGFGQSRMLERTLGRVRAGDLAAGAALRLYEKDLELLRQVAREVDAPLPITDSAQALLHRALARGAGDLDIAALIREHRRGSQDAGRS